MRYEFQRNVTVEGVPHIVGEIIEESAIPVGSIESLLRMQHVKPVPERAEPEVLANVEPEQNKSNHGKPNKSNRR